MTNTQANILQNIAVERQKQDAKWGIQHHSIYKWLAILGEEIGESNKAALDLDLAYVSDKGLDGRAIDIKERKADLRNELIQSAAVIVQILEHIDGEGIEVGR